MRVYEGQPLSNDGGGLKTVITWFFPRWLICGIILVFGPAVYPLLADSQAVGEGEKLVKSQCVGCHRIEGSPVPRSSKKAPDLIWAGSKYQRPWLVDWLQNPKEKLYPVGYDFNVKRKGPHASVTAVEAERIADFLATLKDKRVEEGIMKPGTPKELARGNQLYREHACQNCHRTPAQNKRGYTGGTSSTSLVNMGNRLQADWVYRFNLNPDDFVPESGAYIPKPPLPDTDIYAITSYMRTFGR